MPLNVIIAGGGIGGMAAAAGLAKNGHRVTVYERAATSGGVGFAFRLTANSDRCLRRLGIDSIAGGASAADGGIQHDPQGRVVRKTQENKSVSGHANGLGGERAKDGDGGNGRSNAASVFAYRPQVHRQLWDIAIQNGVRIETGTRVKGVDTDRTVIVLEDGREVQADLLIGADGVNSVVRPHVVDSAQHHPVATLGRNAFRFMLSTEKVQTDDLLSSLFEDSVKIVSWIGPTKSIILYPVDYGKQINAAAMHPEEMSDSKVLRSGPGEVADYDQRVSADTAIAIYSDFEPRVRRLLELADPAGFRIWKLRDMDALPRWSAGRTVLLGDACHPVLPYGFSGASMALEDAAVLCALLPADTGIDDLRDRLTLFERLRGPKVGRVRETSRANGLGNIDKKASEEYFAFLEGFDAVEDAQRHLAASQRVVDGIARQSS